MVAAKAPKTKHYSKSESLNYRVASAVCQKNLGEKYMKKIGDLMSKQSDKVSSRAAGKREKRFNKRKLQVSTVEYKRKRFQLKQSSRSEKNSNELREGTTYETNICLSDPDEMEMLSIPGHIEAPPAVPLNSDFVKNSKVVVFDLETTSLYSECEIVQIAATDGETHFNEYILPAGNINWKASKVNGISKNCGKLFVHGNEVQASSSYFLDISRNG